jgi:signal transduction histidine kinase
MKKYLIFLSLIFCLLGFISQAQGLAQTEGEPARIEVSRSDTLFERKSPMGALLRSVALPGWGQFYNKKYFKSAVVFGAETTFITLAAIEWHRMNKHKRNFQNLDHPDRYWEFEQFQFYEDQRNLYLWITAGIVFLSMFDAYVDAHLYNFEKEKVRDLSISLSPQVKKGDEVRIVFSVGF